MSQYFRRNIIRQLKSKRRPEYQSTHMSRIYLLTRVSIFYIKIILLAYLQINDLGMPKKRLIRQKQTIINSIIKI